MDPKKLRALNADRIKGLQLSAWIKKDTWLQIKPLDEPEEAILAAGLPKPPPLLHLVNRVVAIDGEDDYSYWHRVLAAPAPSRVCVCRTRDVSAGTCSRTCRTYSGAASRRSSSEARSPARSPPRGTVRVTRSARGLDRRFRQASAVRPCRRRTAPLDARARRDRRRGRRRRRRRHVVLVKAW